MLSPLGLNVNTYDEFDPVKCRYVRLTITGVAPGVPIGIIEFTVFGNPVGHK